MKNESISNECESKELDEFVKVVSPGQMLAQARDELGISQSEIAEQLKLRLNLIVDIENDIFENTISDTYNRGYLRSYAKIVKLSETDIIASYKMLSIAKIQCAEMRSFSKTNEKKAANNLLTWATYLILLTLIGSTVMWWLQGAKQNTAIVKEKSKIIKAEDTPQVVQQMSDVNKADTDGVPENIAVSTISDNLANDTASGESSTLPSTESSLTESILPSVAVFTFSGDCWVKIFDATGSRIAVGVKKAGYVMNISGVAPFKVTVGKPERIHLLFNGEAINMKQFNTGNIAKFTLPVNINAE